MTSDNLFPSGSIPTLSSQHRSSDLHLATIPEASSIVLQDFNIHEVTLMSTNSSASEHSSATIVTSTPLRNNSTET